MQAASADNNRVGETGEPDWSLYALAGFICAAAYFVITCIPSLWTVSIDFGLHCVLVARIMTGEIQPVDPTMVEMTVYPHSSHVIAATAGTVFDSPVMGLHVMALISLMTLWGLIAWGMMWSGRLAVLLLSAFLLLMAINSKFAHVELFGNEIVLNYFYPQPVGQTLAIAALLLAGYMERRDVLPEIRYLFLGLCASALISVHLLAAFEVAAVLAVSVAAECYSEWRVRRAFAGAAAIALAVLLSVRNADLWSLIEISQNNGALSIKYISGPVGAVLLAVATIAVSAAILYRWAWSEPIRRDDRLFLKYLASFGLSCGSLCLMQYLMLRLFDKGSEYAVKKYVFGLDTTLLLLAAYAIAVLASPRVVLRPRRRVIRLFCFAAVPLLFVVAPQFKVSRRTIDAVRLTTVERELRYYHDFALEPRTDKSDLAIGIVGSSGDYLLSIVALRAPRSPNAFIIFSHQPVPHPEQIGSIFTSEHSSPWDVPSCRRHTFPNGIVQVDGACVLTAVGAGPR